MHARHHLVNDQKIIECATEYAKTQRKEIVGQAIANFTEEKHPISIFMAGSPGAGKTEAAKVLLKERGNVLRIDADELRNHFQSCGYTGDNSHLFQKAATRLVHEIHDAALKKKISFLLDGTFANENMAKKNIERSLKRNREVFIVFVYQPPKQAWHFVQEREKAEGRRIRLKDFAAKFCASHEVANKIKVEFRKNVTLSLIQKNIDGVNKFYEKSIERIDDFIAEKYTEQQIIDEIQKNNQ